MIPHVIDANVPIVANGNSAQASSACALACINYLLEVKASGTVLIDDQQEILEEYRGNLSLEGQPGVGDMFFRWLWDNQAVAAHCQQFRINSCTHGFMFEEFPHDAALRNFDKDDQKFVAVAVKSGHLTCISNAVDSDWYIYQRLFRNHGIEINFICGTLLFAAKQQI